MLKRSASVTLRFLRSAIVVTKYLLVKVTKQMERFNANVASGDAALQQAPEVVQSVSVNLPINVLLGMVNDLMSVFLSQPVVGLQRIGIEGATSFNVLFDAGLQGASLPICDYHSANLATTFQCSKHDGFVFSASTSDAALAFVEMHIASFSADEGFINFDFTAKLASGFVLQSQTNAMQHEPCGLLGDFQIAGEFTTTDAVLAIGEQPQSGEPLIKADGGILANTSNLHREFALRMMAGTSPSAAMRPEFYFVRAASRTSYRSIRPTANSEIVDAVVGIREVNDCFLQALWFGHGLVLHDQNYSLNQWMSQVNYRPS